MDTALTQKFEFPGQSQQHEGFGAHWQRREVLIDGVPFWVELAPRAINTWDEAIETGSYNLEDLENKEQDRHKTRVEYVSEAETIKVNLAFMPTPLTFPKEIVSPVWDGTTKIVIQRGTILFEDGWRQDVVSVIRVETDYDDRDQIQMERMTKSQIERTHGDRYVLLPERTVDSNWTRIGGRGQPVVEIGKQGTRISQAVQAIQEYCKEHRTDRFQWRVVWEQVKQMPTLNCKTATSLPKCRHGTFRNKQALFNELFIEESGTVDENFLLKLRLTVV